MAIKLGPFEVDAPIGRGGMGEVWRGRHLSDGTDVAIKVLTRKGVRHTQYIEAFRNEVLAVTRLHHPHVITTFDYGLIPDTPDTRGADKLVAGSPYLVMEFARYGSLGEYDAALEWPELRAVLLRVLQALAHAHAHGVIHRDLKPQNILIGCRDGDAIKLTDFGLAHALHLPSSEVSQVEIGWGTPAYMAPEQFRGVWRDYGPWTDLYALGIMAFELSAGYLPYIAENKMELARAHLLEDNPRLLARTRVPDGFAGWVDRLIQKQPHQRFQRAADAIAALRDLGGLDARDTRSGLDAVRGAAAQRQAQTESRRAPHPSDDALTATIVSAPPRQPLTSGTGEVWQTEMATWIAEDASAAGEGLAFDEPEAAATDLMDVGRVPEQTIEDVIVPAALPSTRADVPLTWRRDAGASPLSHHLAGVGLGLFGVRRPPLVGREVERDLLWEVLREVSVREDTRVVTLRGGAGVGKSRLAQWFVARAHEVGAATVLRAKHEARRGPFDGVSAMIARHLRCLGLSHEHAYDRVRHHMRTLWCNDPDEWKLLTEIIAPTTSSDSSLAKMTVSQPSLGWSSPFASHAQRHAVLRRYLEKEAALRPLILWLDDVQWGIEALLFAKHMMEACDERPIPVCLVMTVRDESLVEGSLEEMILNEVMQMERTYACDVHALDERASRAHIEEMLHLTPALATEIQRRARGVPLFAIQLVGQLVAEGKLVSGPDGFRLKDAAAVELPDDIHSLWQTRLERVLADEEARWHLEVASALGVEVRMAEWCDACRRCGLDVDLDLLDRCFTQGLLRKTEDGWAFTHGLLAESLERQARQRGRWATINKACAQMIRRLYTLGEGDTQLRYGQHLVEARQWEGALEPLWQAALRLYERSELREAQRVLDQRDEAIAQIDLPIEDARRGHGEILRARILDGQGRYIEARRWADRVIGDALEYGWRDLYVDANIQSGYATLHQGDTERATALFGAALEALGGADTATERPPQRVWADIGLARVALRRGQTQEAMRRFEAARTLATRIGDDLAVATCLNGLGDVARAGEAWGDARAHVERALEITSAMGNRILIADCFNDLAELERRQGELDLAREHAERAVDLYDSVGSSQSLRAKRTLGYIALSHGEFEQSRAIFEEVAERLGARRDAGQLSMVVMGLVPCLAVAGEWGEVVATVEHAVELLETTKRRHADIAHAARLSAVFAEDAGRDELARRLRAIGARHGPNDADKPA